MSKIYTVKVTNEFIFTTSADVRPLEGLTVPADGRGFVGKLNDDQLKAALADKYVTVTCDGEPVTEVPSEPVKPTEPVKAAKKDALKTAPENAPKV